MTDCLVIRGEPSGGPLSGWLGPLREILEGLESVGTVSRTRLEPVFPNDPNPALRQSAVVYFEGDADRLRDILRAAPDVRAVYRTGERFRPASVA